MTDIVADAEPMDAAVQEDESGRKIKGRGHKDASSLEVRRSHAIYNFNICVILSSALAPCRRDTQTLNSQS